VIGGRRLARSRDDRYAREALRAGRASKRTADIREMLATYAVRLLSFDPAVEEVVEWIE
jgi:hypothetical protein